jgi:Kinesin motor domain
MSNLPAVTVACRIRPRNPKADLAGGYDALYHDEHSVRPADRNTSFTFDAVYGAQATQEVIFNKSIAPLVGVALQGINTTILVYGQVRLLRGARTHGQQKHTLQQHHFIFLSCRPAPVKPSRCLAAETTLA